MWLTHYGAIFIHRTIFVKSIYQVCELFLQVEIANLCINAIVGLKHGESHPSCRCMTWSFNQIDDGPLVYAFIIEPSSIMEDAL